MRTLLLLAVFFFLSSNSFSQHKKALFLGNSYTYYNNLPSMLSHLASSMGDSLYTDQSTPGGYRLMHHAQNAVTYSKINAQEWDFVVLQAQSQEPSWPVSQIEDEVFPYAKQISDSVKANHSCTEVLFFETWGRKNGDTQNCEGWPPVCTFEGMNDRLLVGYYTMAVENNAAMTPVGLAWKLVREDGLFNDINLYTGDGSHPSVYGSYLTACVMYNSMFFKNVESNFYSTISEEEALYLQSKANEVFSLDYEYHLDDEITAQQYSFTKLDWFEYGVSVVPDFDFDMTSTLVNFTNNSINADSYVWNFGDNQTSIEDNPVYNYQLSGQYQVKLVSTGECGSNTAIKTLDVFSSIKQLSQESIAVIQSGKLIFEDLKSIERVELFSVDGKLLEVMDVPKGRNVVYSSIVEQKQLLFVKFYRNNDTSFTQKIVF